MLETGALISKAGDVLHWHRPKGRTSASLPDDAYLWKKFFDNRKNIFTFVHTHPGVGVPNPSWEDITTFAGIEAGLGLRLDWWILSEDCSVVVRWKGPERYDYISEPIAGTYWWVDELRFISYAPDDTESLTV